MALKHLATVLSDFMAPDSAPNSARHTLVRLFVNVGHRGPFPAVKMPFCVMVEMQGDNDPFRVTLRGPDGVGEKELATGVADKTPNLRPYQQCTTSFIAELQPLIIPAPGVYSIVLYSGDTEVHRRDFGVFQLEGE